MKPHLTLGARKRVSDPRLGLRSQRRAECARDEQPRCFAAVAPRPGHRTIRRITGPTPGGAKLAALRANLREGSGPRYRRCARVWLCRDLDRAPDPTEDGAF